MSLLHKVSILCIVVRRVLWPGIPGAGHGGNQGSNFHNGFCFAQAFDKGIHAASREPLVAGMPEPRCSQPQLITDCANARKERAATVQRGKNPFPHFADHSSCPAVRGVSNRGIEKHHVEGVPEQVYSAAKTVADCFEFRNRIGLDVAMEALRDSAKQKKATVNAIYRYAQICRVRNVRRPYLESRM